MAQGIARCDNCKRTSMGVARPAGRVSTNATQALSDAKDADINWFPRTGSAPDFPDVPEHIARAAKEAHSCASINAPMAATLMARTVLEATAKEKGVKTGTLFQKIDEMQAQDLIRKSTQEAAHEIRHFGNDMAHGDIADAPEAEDAAEILELMNEVLNEVFQGPARTARIKAKHTPAT